MAHFTLRKSLKKHCIYQFHRLPNKTSTKTTMQNFVLQCIMLNEPPLDKTNKMACVPSKDPGQPGHLPSLIRVFAFHMKKAWVLSYPLSAQRRLWTDWADAQADLSLHWMHSHFVGFVMRRLKFWSILETDASLMGGNEGMSTSNL